jgi:hypothetical protein
MINMSDIYTECCGCSEITTKSISCGSHTANNQISWMCNACVLANNNRSCTRCGNFACYMKGDKCQACRCDNCENDSTWSCERCWSFWCNECEQKRPCIFCQMTNDIIHEYLCPDCFDTVCIICHEKYPREHINNDKCPDCYDICHCDNKLVNNDNVRIAWKCIGGAGPCNKEFCSDCHCHEGKCYDCYKSSQGP